MKFAVAIAGGSLAAGLFALQATPAGAAECLSGPKGAAPVGSHWYYRVDRATKKNCWYVRAESSRSAAAASSLQHSPQSETPLQPAVADARAEVIADSAGPAAPATPPTDQAQASNSATTANPPTTVAARWLDQPDADTADTSSASPGDVAASPSAAPAVPAAPAAVRSAQPSGGVPTLLFVIVGALAAAAAVAGMLFGLGRVRGNRQVDFQRDRAPWDTIDLSPAMPSPPVATGSPLPQTVPELRQHDAVIPDEIVQMLSKLSKGAPA
jgi:hypothetical protein